MANRDQYRRLIEIIEVLVLTAIFTAMFVVLWVTIYREMTNLPIFRRGNWAIMGSYPILILVFDKVFGAFHLTGRGADIVFSHIGSAIITNVLSYFVIVLATRYYAPVWPLAALLGVELVLIIIWAVVVKGINNSLFPVRNMVLVHGDFSYKDMVLNINEKSEHYNITETINISEGLQAIQQRIENFDSVMIADLPAQLRNDVLKFCYDAGKRVYLAPKLSDIIIRGAEDVHVGDTQIYLLQNFGLSADQRFIKRTGDIVVSGLALIIFSWLMGIIALLIKLEDKGPAFYKQERLTRDGKVFKIIKFRSMVVDAEKLGPQLSKKGDSRVTKIGYILRLTHLDELPQFLNVFKGDMSVIGPRPERPEIMKQYMESVPEFGYRLKVKGGITGYAQIYGKYNTTPYNKLRLDLIYIQNYSVWLDVKCLIQTVKVVFRKETSEGVDDDQVTALK